MKIITNNSQSYMLHFYGFIIMIITNIFIVFFLLVAIIRFIPLLAIICSILCYFITRAIRNAYFYYLPKEECYCENGIFVYKRILFGKNLLQEYKIPVLQIKNIEDKGYQVPNAGGSYLNFFYYVVLFYKHNERILIELDNGEKYSIFSDSGFYIKNKLGHRYDDKKFLKGFNEIKEMVEKTKIEVLFNQEIERLIQKYNSPLDERYNCILNKILDEEKVFLFKKEDVYIINGDSEAIKNLEIFKDMKFEEIDFYIFYVNYLSKKEYQDKKVLVGYNEIDGKEVTMFKLKEDINEIRDSRSTFKEK